MKKIKIEIENSKMADLGVDQPIKYGILNFNEAYLLGYWVTTNEISFEKGIIFYLGSQTFLCEYTEHNIEILSSALIGNNAIK